MSEFQQTELQNIDQQLHTHIDRDELALCRQVHGGLAGHGEQGVHMGLGHGELVGHMGQEHGEGGHGELEDRGVLVLHGEGVDHGEEEDQTENLHPDFFDLLRRMEASPYPQKQLGLQEEIGRAHV